MPSKIAALLLVAIQLCVLSYSYGFQSGHRFMLFSQQQSLSRAVTLPVQQHPSHRDPLAPRPRGNNWQVASTVTDETVSDEVNIPKILPSEKGLDYVPLATMLATGDFLGADQFTRDALIKLCGAEEENRNFVYWTEVNKIPAKDLATIEHLWLLYSGGKFGYTVQRRVWDVENGNFEKFIRRIGWTKNDNGIERKLRWFGSNEFVYDLQAAPKGHLPLTSALRGTQLVKRLLNHPVWDQHDWKNYENIKWE